MAVPALVRRIEEEVKNGDIAVRLIRPLSYVGYHYISFMSKRISICRSPAVGSIIAWTFAVPHIRTWLVWDSVVEFGGLPCFFLNVTVALVLSG